MRQPGGLSVELFCTKKTLAKGHKLRESIYMAFWKWQIYIGGERISGCQGLGPRERGTWLWPQASLWWS